MYKEFKIKNIRVAVNVFPNTTKRVSDVYLTGYRKWHSFEDTNYSLVVGRLRLILSIDKHAGECCE